MLSAFIRSGLSYPAVPLAGQLVHQRSVLQSPLVLKKYHLKYRTATADRDRPGSRRSEPSSRATLIGEQPNPWDRLQPQDVTSRHRGAKPLRRYGRSGAISLLSPEYLLSGERRPFHMESPDHYALVSHLLDLSVSQLSRLIALPLQHDCQPCQACLWAPPLPFRRRPPQSNCPPDIVPHPDSRTTVRRLNTPGWYFKDGSTPTSVGVSVPPTYPTQAYPNDSIRLQ